MARDGRSNAGANDFQIKPMFFAGKLVEQLLQHVLDLGCLKPCRSDLYRDSTSSKRFRFEAVELELTRNFGEYGLLRRGEFHEEGHEQPLALDFLSGSLLQHAFKEDSLMRNMLVDNPEPIAIYGEDEGVPDLSERL